MAREKRSTTTIETTAEAISMAGRVVTLKCDRKSASRVALPATCWAIMAAAASIAATAGFLTRGAWAAAAIVRLGEAGINRRAEFYLFRRAPCAVRTP